MLPMLGRQTRCLSHCLNARYLAFIGFSNRHAIDAFFGQNFIQLLWSMPDMVMSRCSDAETLILDCFWVQGPAMTPNSVELGFRA